MVNMSIPEDILRWMKETSPNDASTSSPNNACTIDGIVTLKSNSEDQIFQ